MAKVKLAELHIADIRISQKSYPELFKYIYDNSVDSGDSQHNLDVAISLMDVGVTIMNKIQVSSDVEVLKKEFENLTLKINDLFRDTEDKFGERLSKNMDDNFNPDSTTSYLGKTISHIRKELADFNKNISEKTTGMIENASKLSTQKLADVERYLVDFKKHVDGIKEQLDKELDESYSEGFASSLKDKLDEISEDDSPLVEAIRDIMKNFREGFEKEIQEVRDMISKEEGKVEMISKTSQMKGQLFEDELLVTLEQLARPFGDSVEATGTQTKGSASKKGDFIYELSEGHNIVLEAKDTNVTLNSMRKYLDEAMETREASFSILVAKHIDNLPKQVGCFNMFDGNKIFVTVDFLEFAIRFARMYLLQVSGEVIEGVDKTAIVNSLETIRAKFKEITAIKTKLSKLKNSTNETLDTVTSNLESIVNGISDELKSIESEIETE